MTVPSPPAPLPDGLEAVFLAHRETLLRFLKARGAGDATEDLLHEVWLKVSAPGRVRAPVAAPLPYLFQVANSLMIDRYRAHRQAALRDQRWVESTAGDPEAPGAVAMPERIALGRDLLARIDDRLASLGPRAAAIFRRHRIDGIAQREVAAEFGLSLSTVESDLRTAYRALTELREQTDEA